MKKTLSRLLITVVLASFFLADVSIPVIAGTASQALTPLQDETCESGHTLDNGVVIKEPTCTERGITKYTCSKCGLVLTDNNIQPVGHQSDNGEVCDATDEVSAYLQYHCVRCGMEMGVCPISEDMAKALKPQSKKKTLAVNPTKKVTKKAEPKKEVKEEPKPETKEEVKEEPKAEQKEEVKVEPKEETQADNQESEENNKKVTRVFPADLKNAVRKKTDFVMETSDESVYWIIRHDDIFLDNVRNMNPINLDVSDCTDEITSEVKAAGESADNNQKFNKAFDIKHKGYFGFKAYLNVKLKDAKPGDYANLYYFDRYNMRLIHIDSSEIGTDGEASFRMNHASRYVIFTSKVPMTQESVKDIEEGQKKDGYSENANMQDSSKKSTSPLTLAFIIIIAVAAIAYAAISFIKKKGNKEP